jgi:hypothetical protein
MAKHSGGRVLIFVALIGLAGTLGAALISKWPSGPETAPDFPLRPPPSNPSQVSGASPDAVADAMVWIESRCGPGIELVAPSRAGSPTDISARQFVAALGNSGVKPVPLVVDVTSVFTDNGRFSVDKFNPGKWAETSGKVVCW